MKTCKYCDGWNHGNLYGDDEPECCLHCGAEWEPVEDEDFE